MIDHKLTTNVWIPSYKATFNALFFLKENVSSTEEKIRKKGNWFCKRNENRKVQ